MDVIISPSKLCGKIALPSSKSHAIRLIICAALCDSPTKIGMSGICDDIKAALGCAVSLGCEVRRDEKSVTVIPNAVPASRVFDCGESATLLRLLLFVAAATGGGELLRRGSLIKRDMTPITDILTAHGVSVTTENEKITLSGKLSGNEFFVPANISSQYLS